MIPSLDADFDRWAGELAKAMPLDHHRLVDFWHRLLADKNLFKSHRNPLYVCRAQLLERARGLGFAGATR